MHLPQTLPHPVPPLDDRVLAGVVGAVGEPEGEVRRARRLGDRDALQQVIGRLASHRRVRVADAAELVRFLLEQVRIDGADPQAEIRRMLPQRTVVVDLVPGDVNGDGGRDPGQLMDLRRVLELLERVPRHAWLRKDFEAGAGVAVAPGGRLHFLRPQPLFHSRDIDALPG